MILVSILGFFLIREAINQALEGIADGNKKFVWFRSGEG